MQLDHAKVFGGEVAVLAGADQPQGGAMVRVEGKTVQVLRQEHVISHGILDGGDRAVSVETREGQVRDRHAPRDRGSDDASIEGLERYSLPAQTSRRPSSHTMKVGIQLPPGKRCEIGERYRKWGNAGADDLDHR